MSLGSAVVAGHICLDIIPQFDPLHAFDFKTHFQPGSLNKVGPAIFSTGGAVSNTGLILHKLGLPTRLIARTGIDPYGQTVRSIVAGFDPTLAEGLAIIPGAVTSYSVIISPPGIDRLFIHCPGANDEFSAADVPDEALAQADLFHFGYPPVMRQMYQNGGAELVHLYQRAKAAGVTTSLDLCLPDPASEAGLADWAAILEASLPSVDVFTPSLDELLFMLDRPAHDAIQSAGPRAVLQEQPDLPARLGRRLLDMGARIVLIKLGDCGAYLCTANQAALRQAGRAAPLDRLAWAERELWSPCFQAQVVGATGSGDATIAGFLSALLRRLSPEAALTSAVAVGACNVEAADALSGVPGWDAVQQRIAAGWPRRRPFTADLPGWRWQETSQLWQGEKDAAPAASGAATPHPAVRWEQPQSLAHARRKERHPQFIINSVAPIRVCDLGGWTDTWFAGHGKIFNIGVYPYAEAQLKVFADDDQNERIIINAENYGERYVVIPEKRWDKHPLLEASIAYMKIPAHLSFEIGLYSEAPGGASTGTSAAVTVALIGALDSLTPGRLTPHEVALAAQRVETEMLGGQCGIQDQIASAYGGINYIEMFNYPYASVSQLQIPNTIWWELERRLTLIYLGKSHRSSDVHEMVIRGLENAGPDCQQLSDLRHMAPKARDALFAGDFNALGAAMRENTAAQSRLHSSLVSPEAQRVIEIAQEHGALGWKVNGAGGDGGSVTILNNDISEVKRAMIREIEQENALFKHIPLYLSRYGLRVWKQDCASSTR